MNSFDMNGFDLFATNEQGIDMTIVWMYRHILGGRGSVKVTPDKDDPNEFSVAFYNSNGQVIASASLPRTRDRINLVHSAGKNKHSCCYGRTWKIIKLYMQRVFSRYG